MFCRFCGKMILDDSDFCPYCGQALGQAGTRELQSQFSPQTGKAQMPKRKNTSNSLQNFSKWIWNTALLAFIIFYVRMAPGFGWTRTISYAIGVAVAILLSVLFHKITKTSDSKAFRITAAIFAIIVLIASIGLRITYEAKIDAAIKDVPPNGSIHLRIHMEEKFYSYVQEGFVKNPRSSVKIGDIWYESGNIVSVELNNKYTIRVSSSYNGAGGYADSFIIFSPDDVKDVYLINKKVDIGANEYADVTLSFTRECDFWEVIFH
jgi:hypothetical protein